MKPPRFVKASIIDVVKRCWKLSRWFSGDVSVLPAKLSRHAHSDDHALPVVLMGTSPCFYAFGYGINTLTMFAMVLAIGLWSTMPSWWWKTSNVSRAKGSRRVKRRANHGTNPGGAGRYRDGAVCGIRADGVLWRYHRGDLSSVFYYHCLGNGAQ